MSTPPPDVPLESSEPDGCGQLHPKESPELIKRKLQEFHEFVKEMPQDETAGVHQAQDKCPDQLDDDFKLMFLRAEVFHVDLAAKRYCKYWERRIERFGPDKAFLPLTLDGAFKDDHVAINLGFMQPLGTREPNTGRPLILVDPSHQDRSQHTRESLCRSLWYMVHSVLKDDDVAQRKGVVLVVTGKTVKFGQFDRAQAKMNMESISGCLPLRISVAHMCHPPKFFAIVFAVMKLFLGDTVRKRIRVHSGSDKHVVKTLEKKFGLTKDVLPTELSGAIVVDHQGWVKKRQDAGL
uniref:CRAL-TRIO domain-containing protein n=1 Tax=Craspedostauros australis TaxID=1486917 RepID=A0A7R9WVG2_9STRA|mmetsp:Transcript_19498/g.54198  ORF Transcript_19498/g.54198 Transcript_19498/m.54198 type:complete len:294 (+) Transcript_19498:186-1067(+)|eukprot:CAMPEP_0198113762 /NCGR_PEP_ID=MMETSP1442-20131203/5346_1 /TAXON_ID= /ORGANISM="Craspedostauros australis, Strain CCMP3328" /LENGTH=293 /DNA_ID=CAMNT_0043770933 /DNA_START=121 /DNA_END=1002 /DNA_ORIENTATION=-